MAQAKQPPPIQYRPGPLLGRWVTDLAATWRLHENEVARRLAALAACRLDADCYPLLVKLAAALAPGGARPDFVLACDHVRTALDSANRARQDLAKRPLGEAETRAFIARTVEQAVRRRVVPLAQAEQEQQVQATVVRTR
jgi:hypothetical protein